MCKCLNRNKNNFIVKNKIVTLNMIIYFNKPFKRKVKEIVHLVAY